MASDMAPDDDVPGLDDAPELDEPLDMTAAPSDMVAEARRRHGLAGAMVAAGMLGIDQVLGRKPREEAPVVVDSSSDPHDVDRDGIVVEIDDVTSVTAPALPRTPPVVAPKGRRRR